MGERMQGSWYTAGQILQQLEKATRCRTSAPDRTERPCKTYHLSNSNNYILNSVKSTFHTFPFESFKVYSLRNYFSIFILSLVSLWLWIDFLPLDCGCGWNAQNWAPEGANQSIRRRQEGVWGLVWWVGQWWWHQVNETIYIVCLLLIEV